MAAVQTNGVVEPAATSWGAVLGGWVATIGASVIFAPLVAGVLAAVGSPQGSSDLALAVPVVIGVLLSYLVGGYVAGRMAAYRTSWHGLMTAFFSLFVLLLVLLVGAAADRGMLSGSGVRSIGDVIPGVRSLNIDTFGNAVSFGAILGFLAAIFGGWLGGLLAPARPAAVAPATVRATPSATRDRVLGGRVVGRGRPVERERVVERDRPVDREPVVERDRTAERGGVVPAYGQKGGERVVDEETPGEVDEVHTTRVERPEDV